MSIAEMMLDGTLCEQCGSFIDEDPCGYPRLCEDCLEEPEEELEPFYKDFYEY